METIALIFVAIIALSCLFAGLRIFFRAAYAVPRRTVKNTMRNTNHIRMDARIVEITPEFHKILWPTNPIVWCDVLIEFSDGSYYCTDIGKSTGVYKDYLRRYAVEHSYSKRELLAAVNRAILEHDRIVQEKNGTL